MKEEYDFSNAIRNPYINKERVTLELDNDTVSYFKALSVKLHIPYKTLISMYLSDCAARKLEPKTIWQ